MTLIGSVKIGMTPCRALIARTFWPPPLVECGTGDQTLKLCNLPKEKFSSISLLRNIVTLVWRWRVFVIKMWVTNKTNYNKENKYYVESYIRYGCDGFHLFPFRTEKLTSLRRWWYCNVNAEYRWSNFFNIEPLEKSLGSFFFCCRLFGRWMLGVDDVESGEDIYWANEINWLNVRCLMMCWKGKISVINEANGSISANAWIYKVDDIIIWPIILIILFISFVNSLYALDW